MQLRVANQLASALDFVSSKVLSTKVCLVCSQSLSTIAVNRLIMRQRDEKRQIRDAEARRKLGRNTYLNFMCFVKYFILIFIIL